MSGLPPLANVFAVHARDPRALGPVAAAMARAGRFELHRPFETWVVGVEPLGGNGHVACDPIFFAEGGDVLVPARDPWPALERLRDLATRAPSRLGELPGDFGFLLVHAGGGTVVRSAAGLVPWYVHRGNDIVVVSTRLAHIARLLPAPPGIDPLVHASWTDGIVCPDRRTPFDGVRSVPAGHAVAVTATDTGRPVCYWDPVRIAAPSSPPPAHVVREHAAQLRALLLAGVERDLDPAGRNLLGLSGGVDSSCIAALAAGPVGRRLMTFSFLPPEQHPRYRHVVRFVDTIAEHAQPVRQWRVQLDEEGRLASHGRAPRLGIPVPHPALSHLPGFSAEADIAVYTGGEFADDLFGGVFVLPFDWLRELSLTDVVGRMRARGRLPMRRRVPARWLSVRARQLARRPLLPYRHRLPELVRPELRAEYRAWSRNRQRAMAALPAPYRFLEMSRQADGWVTQNWEVCSELGVRRSLPFYQRAVIELAMACHPLEHAMPPKNLLRLGLDGEVPAANLHRVDKGSWSERERLPWGRALPERLAPIVREDWMESPPREVGLDDADVLSCLMTSTEPVSAFDGMLT